MSDREGPEHRLLDEAAARLAALRRGPRVREPKPKPVRSPLGDDADVRTLTTPGRDLGTHLVARTHVSHVGASVMDLDELAMALRGARRLGVGRHPGTGKTIRRPATVD